MKTIFVSGFAGERQYGLGQDWGSLFSTLLTTGAKAGMDWYTAKRAKDVAKQAADKAEEQLKQAQAIQAQAQATQQQAQVQQQQAAAAAAAAPAQPIVSGVSNTTLLAGAGLVGVGLLMVLLLRK